MKNILILLTFILFPISSYCEIPNVSDKFMEVKVKIGYDENHFSPLKPKEESESWLIRCTKFNADSLRYGKTNKEDKIKEYPEVIKALTFNINVAIVLFIILTLLGCGLLMIAKIIQVYQKKS